MPDVYEDILKFDTRTQVGSGGGQSTGTLDSRYLRKSLNLSDVDAATALTNLGLTATAAELNRLDGDLAAVRSNLGLGTTDDVQFQDILARNLELTGTIDYVNETNLQVEDVTITLNKGGTTGSAEGAGLLIDAVIESLLWNSTDGWVFSDSITAPGATFTDSLLISSASPTLEFLESDLSDNNARWRMEAGALTLMEIDDTRTFVRNHALFDMPSGLSRFNGRIMARQEADSDIVVSSPFGNTTQVGFVSSGTVDRAKGAVGFVGDSGFGEGKLYLSLSNAGDSTNVSLVSDAVMTLHKEKRVSIGTTDAEGFGLNVNGTSQFKDAITQSSGSIGTDNFSDWFSAAPAGWNADYDGTGDFRTLYIDELIAKAFTVDVAQALAGSDFLTKSVATLAENFTIPAVSSTGAIKLEDLPGLADFQVFESGDWLRIRIVSHTTEPAIIGDVWGTISGYTDNADGTQSWTFTTDYAGASDSLVGMVVNKGAVILDYGVSGDTYIERSVLDRSGTSDFSKVPYDRIVRWTNSGSGGPRPSAAGFSAEVLTQRGNLNGLVSGYDSSTYGMYATDTVFVGDPTKAGNYFEFHEDSLAAVLDEFSITIDTNNSIVADASGVSIEAETFALATPNLTIDSVSELIAVGSSHELDGANDTFSFSDGILSGTATAVNIAGWVATAKQIADTAGQAQGSFASDATAIDATHHDTRPAMSIFDTSTSVMVNMGNIYKRKTHTGFALFSDYSTNEKVFEVSVGNSGSGSEGDLVAQIAGWDFDTTSLKNLDSSGGVELNGPGQFLKMYEDNGTTARLTIDGNNTDLPNSATVRDSTSTVGGIIAIVDRERIAGSVTVQENNTPDAISRDVTVRYQGDITGSGDWEDIATDESIMNQGSSRTFNFELNERTGYQRFRTIVDASSHSGNPGGNFSATSYNATQYLSEMAITQQGQSIVGGRLFLVDFLVGSQPNASELITTNQVYLVADGNGNFDVKVKG